MHYLAACCIAKDENANIKEWLAYHAAIGVEHFYIYDNMSAEPIADFIRGFADDSQVTCVPIAGEGVQIKAYSECLEKYGALCRWIAFIDLDEFIHPEKVPDLRSILAEYEQYAALALNWKMFSSSGHLSRPSGLVIENYTQHIYNCDANLITKCIVQPRRVKMVVNPHFFGYVDGFYAVNADFVPAPQFSSRCFRSQGKASINHYQYKSQQDFECKQRRGRGDVPKGEKDFPYSMFYNQAVAPWREDRSILRFAPRTAEMLRENRLAVHRPQYKTEELIDNLAETLLRDKDDLTAASVYLCHAAMHYEDNAAVWFGRAYIMHQRGQLEEALRFAEQGLKYEQHCQLFAEYFYLSVKLGKLEQAVSTLEYMEQMTGRLYGYQEESLNEMKKFLALSVKKGNRAGV